MKLTNRLLGTAAATIAFAAALATAAPADAQSKSETKLYNTVLAKKDIKNANKFLAKYPNSTYAPAVQRIKDSVVFHALDNNDVTAYMNFVKENPNSAFAPQANGKIELLNTSSISNPEAFAIATQHGIPAENILGVKGVKSLNKEHIAVIQKPQNGNYTIVTLVQNNGSWEQAATLTEPVYTNDYQLNTIKLSPELYSATVGGMQHLFFAYTNTCTESDKRSNIPNNNIEYVANLYSLADNAVYNVLYSGKHVGDEIFGSTMDSAQGGMMATPQTTWLFKHLRANQNLKPFDKSLFLTQQTIEWWYENNPKNAGNMQFGVIPEESELVNRFKEYKEKEEVGQYTVAMFDICHNTVVVVYNKADMKYSLALCQTTPVNNTDLELGSFYGEKGNTLVLYFYKGKETIKKRLNLGSKRYY